MDQVDKYMQEMSAPLPEEPKWEPAPEATPMEKTVLVDVATEVENKKTYDHGRAWQEKKLEGNVAPPVDVYEPGFRSDLAEAIKDYFKKQKATRDRVQAIREKTGIGRYVTWSPQ
jgi:hypothetical protein